MRNRLMTATKASISEVMETMFFIPVECVENPSLEQIRTLKGMRSLGTSLTFTGDAPGSIQLLIPKQLLTEMTENFMGEPRETLGENISEGTLKETVNMISGNALRKIKTRVPFGLSIPELIRASDFPETGDILLVETIGSKMAVHITTG